MKDFALTGSSSDVIEFATDLFADFASAMDAAEQVGRDVVITHGDDLLTPSNLQIAALSADDFRFV